MNPEGKTGITPSISVRSTIWSVLIIAIVGLVMLVWSWQTWCDPLIDFGTEVYIPWQMTAGKVLYRDLHYFNGPFTQYLNAWLFNLLGVSIRTLVIGNLAVLIALLAVLYRLTGRAFGSFSACACGLSFVLLFAFGQGVSTANYNWLTPYRNDLTHGIALAFLAIALLDRFARSGRFIHLIASGLVTGLVFLTRAEPFLATAAAIAAMASARLWIHHLPMRRAITEVSIFTMAMLAVPAAALGLLSLKMPVSVAALGVAGSWPWVFDRRVTALPFYQNAAGTDDLTGNLSTIFEWTIVYAALAGAGVALAFQFRSRRISSAVPVFLIGASAMFIASRVLIIDWNNIIRPLPVCLLVMAVFAAIAIVRGTKADDRASLRLGLIVFSGMMLLKIALNVHVYHYGFALAMPGTLMVVAVAGDDLPSWIRRRGGNGDVFRAVAAVCWGTAVFVTLYVDHLAFASKQTVLGTDGDTFLADAGGAEVKAAVKLIDRDTPPGSTLMVLPQGLMVNYLARRTHPIASLNFMPPEVLAEGENRIIAAMIAHPPDEILVNTSVIKNGAFTLEGKSPYGRKTLDWVRENYVKADQQAAGPVHRFVLMERKKK